MPITLLYAGALGLVFMVLTVRVLQARGQTKVNLGDGGNELMIRRMRGQANFVEYTPLGLVLMALLETQGQPAWALHALGGTLLVARALHGYTFAFAKHFPPGRFLGASLSMLAILAASVVALWLGIKQL